jgi:hypothetical protein
VHKGAVCETDLPRWDLRRTGPDLGLMDLGPERLRCAAELGHICKSRRRLRRRGPGVSGGSALVARRRTPGHGPRGWQISTARRRQTVPDAGSWLYFTRSVAAARHDSLFQE